MGAEVEGEANEDDEEAWWNGIYTEQEMRTLKAVHVDVPEMLGYADISLTKKALCDNGLISTEEEQDSEKELIKKGMIFDILDEMKF